MLKKSLHLNLLCQNKMLSFIYFVNSFLWEMEKCLVLGKHNEKIKVSSNLIILGILQNLRLRGVYLQLLV